VQVLGGSGSSPGEPGTESQENVCVFRCVPQPGPRPLKPSTQAGTAQIVDFTVTTAGADLLYGGAVELPAARTSAFSQVSRQSWRGELTVARNSTLEK
jgi:hypothetical protein